MAHNGWMIQVGALASEGDARARLTAVKTKGGRVLAEAEPFTEATVKSGTTLYRARFAGFDRDQAEAACRYLKRNDVECMPIRN
jgi:D-alanyl-D-alanine carboxypeptidase